MWNKYYKSKYKTRIQLSIFIYNPKCRKFLLEKMSMWVCILSYELLHLLVTALFTSFAVFGGIYAIRTLMLLSGSPEMFKTQRKIWLPILIGSGFFILAGVFHFSEDVFQRSLEMPLLHHVFEVMGYSFIAFGIYRYWRLQKTYHQIKQEALRKIKS